MNSKLMYLAGVSFKRKAKSKWFIIVNILLLLVISVVVNIDSVISLFGGDFNKIQNIYVVDNTNMAYEVFDMQLTSIYDSMEKDKESYNIEKIDKTEEEAKTIIEENKKDIVVIFNDNEEKVISVQIISDGFIDTVDYQLYSQALKNTKVTMAIQKSNIPIEEINKLYSDVDIERIILDENKKSEEEGMSMIMTTVFPVIILPFFMLTIFLVQMIGAEVNDEKTTKGMEIIISNVSPKTHFFSKLIAGNCFVIMQGLLLVAYVGIAFLIRSMVGTTTTMTSGIGAEIGKIVSSILSSSIGSKLVYIIPLTLVLMLLTFVAYSILAGVLASMTTNTEDFQQIQTPIMLISLLGYYLAIMAGVFNGALFIRILSYVPLISAILSPSLLVLEQIGVVDIIISIGIMIITNILFVKYGLRIYKVGILNYSAKGLWKKMFKAMKK